MSVSRWLRWSTYACGALGCVAVFVPACFDRGTTECRWHLDYAAIRDALELYAHSHHGHYPSELSQLLSPDANTEGYVIDARRLHDKWGWPYAYVAPSGPRLRPFVFSAGPDHELGTADDFFFGY